MSKKDTTIPFDTARRYSQIVIRRLAPYCKKTAEGKEVIAALGDIRRHAQRVGSIDIVMIPGDAWNLYQEILTLTRPFKPVPDLPKYKSFKISGVKVNLFIADDRDLGTMIIVKTGPERYVDKLCERAKEMGWELRRDGTGLFNQYSKRIDTPTEISVFNALGMQPPAPQHRA